MSELSTLHSINWEDIPFEIVNDQMKRRIVSGDRMMVAQIHLKDGFVVPLHTHDNEQITQVISGKMQFWFGANREVEKIFGPGDVVVIPSNLPHEAKMLGDVVEMDMWAPPRQDWLDKTDDYLRK